MMTQKQNRIYMFFVVVMIFALLGFTVSEAQKDEVVTEIDNIIDFDNSRSGPSKFRGVENK